MSEKARVIGFTPPGPERRSDDWQQALRAILADMVDLQLRLAGDGLDGSPSSPARHAVFEKLQGMQRRLRAMLGPEPVRLGELPAAAGEIVAGYRTDLAEQMNALQMLLVCQDDLGKDDKQLRVLGLAADSLAGRINAYLGVKALCS